MKIINNKYKVRINRMKKIELNHKIIIIIQVYHRFHGIEKTLRFRFRRIYSDYRKRSNGNRISNSILPIADFHFISILLKKFPLKISGVVIGNVEVLLFFGYVVLLFICKLNNTVIIMSRTTNKDQDQIRKSWIY